MRNLFLMAIIMLLAGCGFSREIEIRQGNTNLKPAEATAVMGKDTNEVRQLLGPPQSRWNLDKQVWLYYIKPAGSTGRAPFLIEVHFGSDGRVDDVVVRERVLATDNG